ncbi:uncharacterized protein LOC124440703 isoform X1 [Xenia sp. Carnegie-2017]|uniref:uncharacterized protein LOC124440703 isoform X1 n=1 Tax=Xenia sp. Carnegie-2017 TaxID=2897299 RepID=UPI001F049497|nr:uncharacterized protein LOC124440703 isoform X1 [Xenia sp. Carnegie-2017]XP_046847086.1 uncharacterized protein LOC124440703 isoform X1 [Xenia sp. Carnegie-2017]
MSKKLNKGESGSNISGSPTACKQAQKDILKSVNDFQDLKNYKKEVSIERKYVGVVIGKRHTVINSIMAHSETQIIVPAREEQHGDFVQLVIIGEKNKCLQAESLIRQKVNDFKDLKNYKKEVSIERKYVGVVVGKDHTVINRIIANSETQINVPLREEQHGDFVQLVIIGEKNKCLQAESLIQQIITEFKEKEDRFQWLSILKKHIPVMLGGNRKTKEYIETKSGARIWVPKVEDPHGDVADVKIIGEESNCRHARFLIFEILLSFEDKMQREKYGGDVRFVCLDNENEEDEYNLHQYNVALRGYIKGEQYRIYCTADRNRSERETINDDIKLNLLPSLQKLAEIKKKEKLSEIENEEKLRIDLWCHIGKMFVSNVDPVEEKQSLTASQVKKKLQIGRRQSLGQNVNNNEDRCWHVSFQEGVRIEDFDDEYFPNKGKNDDFNLKLLHTQWRFDFTFKTPSVRTVRLKAWKCDPLEMEEPPFEVKNILREVDLKHCRNIKAWLCRPSVTVAKGEIMSPKSSYDCRIKLRAGPRFLAGDEAKNEAEILCDYLSNCKFDEHNSDAQMILPDENEMKIPDGFDCLFYREAKEKFYNAEMDGEVYKIIVLHEKGWDSNGLIKIPQNQLGMRFVSESWSKKLLDPDEDWTPEEILAKLKNYMDFFDLFTRSFFQE